jgi:NADH dehydrogenase [ubiquinone] 1 alpha subcomplex assembly factor 1
MKLIIYFMIAFTSSTSNIVFDFHKDADLSKWIIVNDGVMGGLSNSSLQLDKDGNGVFKGHVTTKNYGGFASIRNNFDKISIKKYTSIKIKVKSQPTTYQLRLKVNSSDYYAYITTFKTTGNWDEIEIPLNTLYPSYRGRKLDMGNLSSDYIEEVSFLIGNNKEEDFILLIDRIELH